MGEARERPILFSGPMVRAILEGRKTQTRRLVKGGALHWLDEHGFTPEYVASPGNGWSPFGYSGDRLWVRETFACIHVDSDGEDYRPSWDIPPGSGDGFWTVVYAATDRRALDHQEDRGFPWRPSIHMPRWASRILLEITAVRVERLQEISEEGAIAEGVHCWACGGKVDGTSEADCACCFHSRSAAIPSFEVLWDEINGKRASWASNPWVWVLDFRRLADGGRA